MWGVKEEAERKREESGVPTAGSSASSLGVTLRKACISAIWQSSPLALLFRKHPEY